MLEGESQSPDLSSNSTSELNTNERVGGIIEWSPTGRAFKIVDAGAFSSQILPKYFRTSNFSSFQRNLNLYGFSKVRRGPDADMYAHPSFLRGRTDKLSELRKCKSAADRKRLAAVNAAVMESQYMLAPKPESNDLSLSSTFCSSQPQQDDSGRVVSPSPSYQPMPPPPSTMQTTTTSTATTPYAMIAPAPPLYQMTYPGYPFYAATTSTTYTPPPPPQPQQPQAAQPLHVAPSPPTQAQLPPKKKKIVFAPLESQANIMPKTTATSAPASASAAASFSSQFSECTSTWTSPTYEASSASSTIPKSCSAQSLNNLAMALISLAKC